METVQSKKNPTWKRIFFNSLSVIKCDNDCPFLEFWLVLTELSEAARCTPGNKRWWEPGVSPDSIRPHFDNTEREEEKEMNKTIYFNLTSHHKEEDVVFKWWVEGVMLTGVALPGILGNLATWENN